MAYTIYKPLKPVKGVLFDMDGVILDSEKLYTRFWVEGGRALGYPMTKEQAMWLRGRNKDSAGQKIKEFFGPGASYDVIKNKRIELMDAYVDKVGIEPKPGIREILEYLKEQHIPCAITTASPRERVRKYLTPLGLFDLFTAVCTTYDVVHGKPAPDIYLFGAKTLGLPPENCIAIEDSTAGIQSASAAGCMATLVPDQDIPDGDTLERIFILADSLMDVVDVMKAYNGK